MQKLILKIILFISSVLSVNAVLASSLSSIINSDFEQVESVDHHQDTPSLELEKSQNECSYHELKNYKFVQPYSCNTHFLVSFDLYENSLPRIETLISRQKHQIQAVTFQQFIVPLIHQKLPLLFLQVENKIPLNKYVC